MSERRNSILVGAFVIGCLLIAVSGGLFFAGGGLGRARTPVVMVFDGSLHGLTVGAPIALRGVTIGEVTDIDLILDADQAEVRMEVVGELDPESLRVDGEISDRLYAELVDRGLRAQLAMQSLLTGLLYVQLDFHPDTEPKLADTIARHYQLPTIPTELEQLRQSLESIDYGEISDNLSRIAKGLDTLMNSPDTQALPASLRSSLASLESASEELSATLTDSRPALNALLQDGREALAGVSRTMPQLSERLEATLGGLDQALASANSTLKRIDSAASPDSAPRRQLTSTLQELSLAARALRSLARTLEEHPEALLRGRRPEDEP
ncbi:MAG: MlaD family protein [Halieaceae bacterium]|jgi:paraquat-inducible protein B|nr:MlaD family protein [Halieaceae bacterium]